MEYTRWPVRTPVYPSMTLETWKRMKNKTLDVFRFKINKLWCFATILKRSIIKFHASILICQLRDLEDRSVQARRGVDVHGKFADARCPARTIAEFRTQNLGPARWSPSRRRLDDPWHGHVECLRCYEAIQFLWAAIRVESIVWMIQCKFENLETLKFSFDVFNVDLIFGNQNTKTEKI